MGAFLSWPVGVVGFPKSLPGPRWDFRHQTSLVCHLSPLSKFLATAPSMADPGAKHFYAIYEHKVVFSENQWWYLQN